MQIFPESMRKLWNEWELRLMVLLSLFLQIVLIIFSNRRKYTVTPWIRILIWSAYLSADWVATVSLGTLSNSQGDSEGKLLDPNYTLMAFWAPFLLLHLGGPDTITAYSLEDNELWLRHLLGLVVQVGVAFYVFLRSWAGTPLTFLSIPMFVAGIIKYGERTWVLRSASKNHFRDSLLLVPDPGPDYAHFMEKYSSRNYDTQAERIRKEKTGENPLQSTVGDDITVPSRKYIDKAYFLFKNQFKHLYADLILSLDDQKTSEGIIRYMSSEDAFKVVEMELNFMYDVLYTKATVIYSLLGILLRSTSFSFTISTLAAFHFFIDKHQFSNIDIDITYLLLFGAIFLEVYALTKLILSDWSIVWLSSKTNSLADSIYRAITSFRSVITSDKRWSRRMAQNNLIDSCLRDKTKFNQVPRFLDMNNFLERYWYMTWEKVDDMKEPIFSLLLEMTNDVRDLRSLLKHRGDYVITKRRVIETLGWSIVDVKFDHSILLWHIATDLCSYSDDDPNPKSRCKISKCLSEYMLYLLVMCPFMLPKGIGEFRFRDTCSETKRFFQQRSESISNRNEACRLLLEVDTEVEPKEVKGDKSKSVLFEACRLAKELRSLNMEMGEKWKMVSEVWVEMLCYAASHCGWIQHGQQLRRGGELLTHGLSDFKWPRPIGTDPSTRDRSRRCAFHKDHGHTTETCRAFQFLVERLIKAGHLKQYLRSDNGGRDASQHHNPGTPRAPAAPKAVRPILCKHQLLATWDTISQASKTLDESYPDSTGLQLHPYETLYCRSK
ncbi:uncharacterized protein LOC132254348 [Vitis vinifera]|uniref:uncharacterized protein LOC132254348 n=1 Tax=Vitis vinifera TaxID=29760 RepID=UPI0005401D58|nr:uncharacterized protein LOC132254348 [Vitis vinifera]